MQRSARHKVVSRKIGALDRTPVVDNVLGTLRLPSVKRSHA
jgi:hypothetical protein